MNIPPHSDDQYFQSAAAGLRPYSDFEWFAVDCDGFIAFLTSAGLGPIPRLVFRSRPQYDALQQWFTGAPPRDGHVLHSAAKMVVADDWISMARKGLFAYDWNCKKGQYVKSPYHRIASPEKPLTVAELPIPIKAAVEHIRFEASFKECNDFLVENYFTDLNL